MHIYYMPMACLTVVWSMMLLLSPALPRDNGQWEGSNSEIREWYRSLMQPDNPAVSCCGESDAYYAQIIGTDGDELVAEIVDTRPDAPLGRPHIPPGTKLTFPRRKLKVDAGNPVGRAIIFVGAGHNVYCFVDPGGV